MMAWSTSPLLRLICGVCFLGFFVSWVNAGANCLYAGSTLSVGSCLYTPDNTYRACLLSTGYFCIYTYSGTTSLYCMGSSSTTASYMSMQTNGNLVMYTTSGVKYWETSTNVLFGGSNYYFIFQGDRNLVVYDGTDTAEWACSWYGCSTISCSGTTCEKYCMNAPSTAPTLIPTAKPSTLTPTAKPSTATPTVVPTTAFPTMSPSFLPTRQPTTSFPTFQPTTGLPSFIPTPSPSSLPTEVPTVSPTQTPTYLSTSAPTAFPTWSPTYSFQPTPSRSPTITPTLLPTHAPSLIPTISPSASPSQAPSQSPSLEPTAVPTTNPTIAPSPVPTFQPSEAPTTSPTVTPSVVSTLLPTDAPTTLPTTLPTGEPTNAPAITPSAIPTAQPSAVPTALPTAIPTVQPTLSPTVSPSCAPSAEPTIAPSVAPSVAPTQAPSVVPTQAPSVVPTAAPFPNPTGAPSEQPSVIPTALPTATPAVQPTVVPTVSPSYAPSAEPTIAPSVAPTQAPSVVPTTVPSEQPSVIPTALPTAIPTVQPTFSPTVSPTVSPSCAPSAEPTIAPSVAPSVAPTQAPSVVPTAAPFPNPTVAPSERPSVIPTALPSTCPTAGPTLSPTTSPSYVPTTEPTVAPSFVPSQLPIESPTEVPTTAPTQQPTTVPTAAPSTTPTSSPTAVPSQLPTAPPTAFPTEVPSVSPTESPLCQPSINPTASPTVVPTTQPTELPTESPSLVPSADPTNAPSVAPSQVPTETPTEVPSVSPSIAPTESPTTAPSEFPSLTPSNNPTAGPSLAPSEFPTVDPTVAPTAFPSIRPTLVPSAIPSVKPSTNPTASPSEAPSNVPTGVPSESPIANPTSIPSVVLTVFPTATPSVNATEVPSIAPTMTSSVNPTLMPSTEPSFAPSETPTNLPSFGTTTNPTEIPSASPTLNPTEAPTISPTERPALHPSLVPSEFPSNTPTFLPTKFPSESPTEQSSLPVTPSPTNVPTMVQTELPSDSPTTQSTMMPTPVPTSSLTAPTLSPTEFPSYFPTNSPMGIPSLSPSTIPSIAPSETPTIAPSDWPTTEPSLIPSEAPTVPMTSNPSTNPTTAPSISPTFQPSASLSVVPSLTPTDFPSLAPTMPPSIDPSITPTMSPSISPSAQLSTAPSFTVSIGSIGSTSALVTIKFTSTVYFGGTVYCNAILSSSVGKSITSSTITSFVVSGTSSSYFAETSFVNVTLSGLDAVKSYSIYCGLRTSTGVYSTSADILASQTNVTTNCCRLITFTSTPSFMYNEPNYYSNSGSSYFAKNIFYFKLSTLPEQSLIVTPMLLFPNDTQVNSDLVSFAPNKLIFYGNSSSVSRSFSLIPTDSLMTSTGYVIKMSISGGNSDDMAKYNTTSSIATLTIMDITEDPPVPVFNLVRMSDNGNGLYMVFDSSTNYGGMSSSLSWSCSQLWDFSGVTGSACMWLNKTTVFASLSSTSATIITGDTVTLIGGLVAAECVSGTTSDCSSYTTVSKTAVLVSAPLNPMIPQVVLTSSAQFTRCSNVTLDATASVGNGGRSWSTVNWQVINSNGSSPQSAITYLQTNYNISDKLKEVINLPNDLFGDDAAEFTITLTLTNFLGQSSSDSTKFLFGQNGSVPMVKIGGSSSISMKASSTLTLYGFTELSPCSVATGVTYSWSVVDVTTNEVKSLSSTSKNPWIFSLSSYSLTAGKQYSVHFTAMSNVKNGHYFFNSTTSVVVTVATGLVYSKISGATVRYITKNTILDASESYDEDSNSTTGNLKYSWSCTYGSGSGSNYGSSCDSEVGLNSGNNNATSLEVGFSNLVAGTSHYFTVLVSSNDGRSSSTVAEIVPVASDSPVELEFTRTASVLNYGTSATLAASVTSSTDVYAGWAAWIDGERQEMQVETQIARSLSSNDTLDGLNYPLLFSNVDFPAGASVQIRFGIFQVVSSDASSSGSRLLLPMNGYSYLTDVTYEKHRNLLMSIKAIAYSQLTVKINTPPQGGSLAVNPSEGTALETSFLAATSSWQDDASDLPLRFDFRYSTDAGNSYLFLQAISVYSSVSMILPAGVVSLDEQVRIYVRAFDIYLAYNSILNNVTVKAIDPLTINYDTVLDSLFAASSVTGGSDQQVTVLNAVSSTMNSVNCSSISTIYCSSLNRKPCLRTAQTCSSCFTNYTGIQGDANSYCHSPTEVSKSIGDSCSANKDCSYGSCSKGFCVAPTKTCPTSVIGGESLECGGSSRGTCSYFISGRSVNVTQCTILDTACTTRCVCKEGYGGRSCSLSTEQLLQRSSARAKMCGYLTNVLEKSDASSSTMDNLASALLSIYDENEVITSSGLSTCKSSLDTLLSAAYSASDADDSSVSSNLDMTSSTTASNIVSTLSKFIVAGNASFISNSTSSFVKAALAGMTNGQNDMELTSDNFRVRLSRTLVSDLSNASQSVPRTSEESAYGTERICLEFPSGGAEACDDSSGYVSMAISSYAVSPYDTERSLSLTTALLRTESMDYSSTSSETSARRLMKKSHRTQRYLTSDASSSSIAYYLSFPFTQTQTFVKTSQQSVNENGTSITIYNETIPTCSQFLERNDGSGRMIQTSSCSNCNVSTYTNTSVVFACYDITQLCSASEEGDTRRRLLPFILDDDYYVIPTKEETINAVYQTAALTITAATTIANVLTINPFAIDVEQSKGIIAFIGSLVFVTIAGLIYFYRWDRIDREKLIYLDEAKIKSAIKRMKSTSSGAANGVSTTKTNSKADKVGGIRGILASASTCSIGSISSSLLGIREGSAEEQVIDRLRVMIRRAMPLSLDKIKEMSFVQRFFIHPFLHHHDYFTVAGKSSLAETRLMRWTNFCLTIYFGIFFDTLFFTIFYADDGSCQQLTTESTCLNELNPILAETKCEWDVQDGCSLRPPPENKLFAIIVSCVTMILAVPLGFIFDYLLQEICSKRPDFESIGWNSMYWIGVASYEAKTATLRTESLLEEVASESASRSISRSESINMRTQQGLLMGKREPSLIVDTAGTKVQRQFSFEDSATITSEDDTPANKSYRENIGSAVDPLAKYFHAISSQLNDLIFLDVGNVRDEMKVILTKAQPYFNYPLAQAKRASVWGTTKGLLDPSNLIMSIRRIFVMLGLVDAHGQASTTNATASPTASTHHTTIPRLQVRIEKARHKALHIIENLRQGAMDDENTAMFDMNQELLQYFILEQLPAIHRFALKRQCFLHDYASPEKVHVVKWLCGWLVIICSILFFIYWTLAWCLYSGNATFQAWGDVLLANLLQDILLLQVFKVYILYVSTQSAIIPRLLVIQSTLEQLAYDVYFGFAQSVDEGLPQGAVMRSASSAGGSYHLRGLSIMRSSSYAMAAAKIKAAATMDHPEKDFISPQIVDCQLVQHFSPSCRAARSHALYHLPSALLLQHVRDMDIYTCRKPPYSGKVGLLTMVMFTIPVIIGLLGDEEYADSVFESIFAFIITSAYAGIVYLLYNQLTDAIIVICVVGGVWIVYSCYQYWYVKRRELSFLHSDRILLASVADSNNIDVSTTTSNSNTAAALWKNLVTHSQRRLWTLLGFNHKVQLHRKEERIWQNMNVTDFVFMKRSVNKMNKEKKTKKEKAKEKNIKRLEKKLSRKGSLNSLRSEGSTSSRQSNSSNKPIKQLIGVVEQGIDDETRIKLTQSIPKDLHSCCVKDAKHQLTSIRSTLYLKYFETNNQDLLQFFSNSFSVEKLRAKQSNASTFVLPGATTSNNSMMKKKQGDFITNPSLLLSKQSCYYELFHGKAHNFIESIQRTLLICCFEIDQAALWHSGNKSKGKNDSNVVNTVHANVKHMKHWLTTIEKYLQQPAIDNTSSSDEESDYDSEDTESTVIDADDVYDIIESETRERIWQFSSLQAITITKAEGLRMVQTFLSIYQPLKHPRSLLAVSLEEATIQTWVESLYEEWSTAAIASSPFNAMDRIPLNFIILFMEFVNQQLLTRLQSDDNNEEDKDRDNDENFHPLFVNNDVGDEMYHNDETDKDQTAAISLGISALNTTLEDDHIDVDTDPFLGSSMRNLSTVVTTGIIRKVSFADEKDSNHSGNNKSLIRRNTSNSCSSLNIDSSIRDIDRVFEELDAIDNAVHHDEVEDEEDVVTRSNTSSTGSVVLDWADPSFFDSSVAATNGDQYTWYEADKVKTSQATTPSMKSSDDDELTNQEVLPIATTTIVLPTTATAATTVDATTTMTTRHSSLSFSCLPFVAAVQQTILNGFPATQNQADKQHLLDTIAAYLEVPSPFHGKEIFEVHYRSVIWQASNLQTLAVSQEGGKILLTYFLDCYCHSLHQAIATARTSAGSSVDTTEAFKIWAFEQYELWSKQVLATSKEEDVVECNAIPLNKILLFFEYLSLSKKIEAQSVA